LIFYDRGVLCTRRVRDPVRVDFPGEGATEGGGYASDQQQLGLEKRRFFPQITKHNQAERITFGCFLDVLISDIVCSPLFAIAFFLWK